MRFPKKNHGFSRIFSVFYAMKDEKNITKQRILTKGRYGFDAISWRENRKSRISEPQNRRKSGIMQGQRHAEASSTASGYTLLINAESAEGNPALTKGSPAPRIRRICTDLWDDVLSGMIIIRRRALKMHERELRGSDVSRGTLF